LEYGVRITEEARILRLLLTDEQWELIKGMFPLPAGRGQLIDDPLIVAVRDWRAWVVVGFSTCVFFLAGVFHA
jgi:hypothetical protein